MVVGVDWVPVKISLTFIFIENIFTMRQSVPAFRQYKNSLPKITTVVEANSSPVNIELSSPRGCGDPARHPGFGWLLVKSSSLVENEGCSSEVEDLSDLASVVVWRPIEQSSFLESRVSSSVVKSRG